VKPLPQYPANLLRREAHEFLGRRPVFDYQQRDAAGVRQRRPFRISALHVFEFGGAVDGLEVADAVPLDGGFESRDGDVHFVAR